MKRILMLTILFLLLPFQAWAADYYVTQDGAGDESGQPNVANAMPISDFNALSGTGYAGDTFYFSGLITSQVTANISGTSGNQVVLDGYQAGSCDPINSTCSSSALIDRNDASGSIGIKVPGTDYIDVQDFRITECNGGISVGHSSSAAHDINIYRCQIYQMLHNAIGFNSGTGYAGPYNCTVGGSSGNGNNIYDCGYNTAHEDIELYFAHDIIISHNKLWAHDPTGSEDDRGIDGILCEGENYNLLIEYNTIFNHDNSGNYYKGSLYHGHGENGIDLKGSSHHVIIRFNEIYGHTVHRDNSEIIVARGLDHVWIYGNYLHDGLESIQLYARQTYNHDLYVWANIFSGYGKSALKSTCDSPGTQSLVRWYNNTFYDCGSDLYGATTSTAAHVASCTSNIHIRNNLFYNNRLDETDTYLQADIVPTATISNNVFFHDNGTARVRYKGTYYDADGASVGANNTIEDPLLIDAVGENFKLQSGSPCIGDGADLSGFVGSLTIRGTTYNMYYDDCLDPDNTDWSTIPPTVATRKQDDLGSWEKGAYVYTGGGPGPTPNEAPVASIDIPAGNIAIDDESTQALAGSYYDPDGDTCTYVWVIEAETFKEWAVGTAYTVGDLVEDDGGDNGDFYRCILNNTGNAPPNVTYWEDAETVANPGTGLCDTPGIYTVNLKVNDGTVDSTTITRSITVLTGSPTGIDIFTRNSSGTPWGFDNHIATGDASHFNPSYPDTNYGDYLYSVVHKHATLTRKTIVSYDLTSLAGETITDGTFSLYLEDAPGVTTDIQLYSCADAFVEAEATWNIYSTGNSWTGTHGQTTLLKAVEFTTSSTINQYYSWESTELTAYLQSRVGAVAYFILISSITADLHGYALFSSDDDTDGQRPKLSVTYGEEAGTVPELISIECANCDGSYKVGDTIGPFQLNFSETVEYDQTVTLFLDTEVGGAHDATTNVNAGSGTAQLIAPAITVTSDHVTTDLDAIKVSINAGYLRAVDDSTSVAKTNRDFEIGAYVYKD